MYAIFPKDIMKIAKSKATKDLEENKTEKIRPRLSWVEKISYDRLSNELIELRIINDIC